MSAPAMPPMTVVDRLRDAAARQPDAPALRDGLRNWSYAALDAEVERLARHLRRDGVGPDQRVALLLPRGAELVIALHAVMRAGGAYVPVDPDWPEARRAGVIAAASPRRCLTPADVTTLLNEPAPDIALPPPTAGDAAYVLFTSGSTGTPKGVVVEHGQLAAYADGVTDALALPSGGRFALSSTVAADLGNTTLFGAPAVGGCLVVADAATMQDGAAFARFLRDAAVDVVKITPSHLTALLDTPSPALPATLILGGEATDRPLLEAIRRVNPTTRIVNHYGPTETTVGVMVHVLPPDAPLPDRLPLDRVLTGSRVEILGTDGMPVAVGDVGELIVAGAQVARGYLGASSADDGFVGGFAADPATPGGRIYRTGDRARRLPGGGLLLLGRADDQIKIRGFRVEPAEIEAALRALPGVAQAAVRLWGDDRLIGYAVARSGDQLDPAALRAALRDRLPDAMIPTALVILDDLPRLGNGKIDRAALPEPAAPATATAPAVPATPGGDSDPLETLIADLIAGLLERERVGPSDNLFDLGGHSLMVIKLVSRLRRRLGVEVPPGLVFDHPTPAALARALRADEAEPGQLDRAAA
ncbi:non-ribosomal peptide synthetase [Azospirillum griseum]|uniref:Amino acid adenylation domain-containing protein n=1 Tax=Azospirillum griseum TaxID=2496639 RepID=A0A431VL62_9PROT|nr:non-ribosomal peptide synthetase [Azospirillum griseum]RTR22873.1 amino acid adenylation domain-containing protein [Azospirillum griseum]